MSDLLGLYPRSDLALIAENPLPTPPSTAAEAFDLEYEATRRTARSQSGIANLTEEYDRANEGYVAAGMGPLDNPMRADGVVRQELRRMWADRAEAARQRNPDMTVPGPAEIEAAAGARARAAHGAAEQARAVDGFSVSGFAGGTLSAMVDPVQVSTMLLGGTVLGGVRAGMTLSQGINAALIAAGRTAAQEAAASVAGQALVEASAAPYRASIGLETGLFENLAGAAIGGAVLGGGLRGLLEGWRLARLPHATPAERVAAQDIEARLLVEAGNPGGPERLSAHADALDAATAATAAGRILGVEVPPPPPVERADVLRNAAPVERLRLSTERIAAVLDGQGDDAAAAWREDLGGPIRVFYGREGDPNNKFRGGEGLAHIIAHRNAQGLDGEAWVRERLPLVLEHGTQTRIYTRRGPGSLRVDLEWEGHRVVVRLERDGARENWVLSGFPLDEDGPGVGEGLMPASAYAQGSPGTRPSEGAGPSLGDISPIARRFNAFTASGRRVLLEPRVVELSELIPSHRPDGSLNPAYPHAEGVQPRDRGAAPSQDQVRAIAAAFEPRRLGPNSEAGFGAPIVGQDLVVESGNGRAMAIAQVYARPELAEHASAYRAFIEAQGYDTSAMRQPVLVSTRISTLTAEQRRAFVQEANGRGTLASSAAETARADAKAVDPALHLWRGGDVDAAGNAPFVRAFLSRLPAAERGDMLTAQGRLTAAGVRRIQAALLASAYGDALGPLLSRFLETYNTGLRGLVGALTDQAGGWARMRQAARAGEIDPATDITAELGLALRAIDESRAKKLPLPELLAQTDIELPPLPDTARALLATLHADPSLAGPLLGRDRLNERLGGYVEAAMRTEPQGALLPGLGVDEISPTERLAQAVRRSAEQVEETGQAAPGLFDDPGEAPVFRFDAATRPAAEINPPPLPRMQPEPTLARQLERAEVSRRAEESAPPVERVASQDLLEAQRLAAQQDFQVPVGVDENGQTITRSARELLDEAEDEVKAASQVQACLIGGATP